MDNNYKNIITVKFAQAQQPKFEERKGKGYIEFGENNDYPKYLLDLYNESPKHGAIVKGKANYIYGKGFEGITDKANTKGESWNQIAKKCVLDDELYGGYYLQIIYNLLGNIKDVYHLEFHKVRTNKSQSEFKVKNDWSDTKEKERTYKAFDGKYEAEHSSKILYVKQYNPRSDVYPLPNYFQALNYIESDVQVSRHILGNAVGGFVGNTLIQMNGGEPQEEHKSAVEKDLKKKFTGSEGDRVVIVFNSSKDNAVEISQLGNTMLTKEDFTNVNNLIQQEIFAGHQVTSPMLFGIKTEGQLGGRSEVRDAYEIFNNTYVNERQQAHEEVFGTLLKLKGIQGEFKIIPVEPLGFEFGEVIQSENLSKDEMREIMGYDPLDTAIKTQAQIISENINALSPLVANKVLESMTPDEIRSLAGLIPVQNPGAPLVGDGSMPAPPQTSLANESIKNLTGRQFQGVMRIVNKYMAGKLSKEQASLLLKQGFSFTDTDIDQFLGTDSNPATNDQKFSDQEFQDFALLTQFSLVGESKDSYEVLSSKAAREAEYFADVQQLSQLESNILNLIKKDKRITAEVIATTLKQDVAVVSKAMSGMEQSGVFTINSTKQGDDTIIERTATDKGVKGPKATTTEILLRYSYEGPKDERNRPFCAKLMELNRIYSRSDIETISERLGYSVWDRRGGWFTQPNGEARPFCRHQWFALTVIRKK